MHFNTHQMKLIESIEITLSKSKNEIIGDFIEILQRANDIFKTDDFNFWLIQLEQTTNKEIPMTHYGISEAKRAILSMRSLNRVQLRFTINDICEMLFTYCDEDDMCDMQGNFYYYIDISSGIVFKESQFGTVVPKIAICSKSEIRIAKVSELIIEEGKLLL